MDFLSWPKGDDESRVYQTSPLVFSSNTRAFSARSGVECYDGGVNGKEKASQGYIYIYIYDEDENVGEAMLSRG